MFSEKSNSVTLVGRKFSSDSMVVIEVDSLCSEELRRFFSEVDLVSKLFSDL